MTGTIGTCQKRSRSLCNKLIAIPFHCKRKICQNVIKIYQSTKDVCQSNKNLMKKVFTHFTLTAIKIGQNITRSKCSTSVY